MSDRLVQLDRLGRGDDVEALLLDRLRAVRTEEAERRAVSDIRGDAA